MSDNAETKSLMERLAKVEAQLPKRTVGKAPDVVPLAECNAAAERYNNEILVEKRDAATMAKNAIDAAFGDRTKGKRVQKNLSPVFAEKSAVPVKQKTA